MVGIIETKSLWIYDKLIFYQNQLISYSLYHDLFQLIFTSLIYLLDINLFLLNIPNHFFIKYWSLYQQFTFNPPSLLSNPTQTPTSHLSFKHIHNSFISLTYSFIYLHPIPFIYLNYTSFHQPIKLNLKFQHKNINQFLKLRSHQNRNLNSLFTTFKISFILATYYNSIFTTQTTQQIKFQSIQMKSSKFSKEIHSESQSFELQAHQMKKFGFQINKKKITQGGWSHFENKIYLDFLILNHDDFKSQLMRRKTRVFYRMSKLLKKRTPDQCRSHHQKLVTKHKGSIEEVIRELQSKTQDVLEMRTRDKCSEKLKNTLSCTIEQGNDIQIQNDFPQRRIIDYQDYFTAELTARFLQLNINLDQIRKW